MDFDRNLSPKAFRVSYYLYIICHINLVRKRTGFDGIKTTYTASAFNAARSDMVAHIPTIPKRNLWTSCYIFAFNLKPTTLIAGFVVDLVGLGWYLSVRFYCLQSDVGSAGSHYCCVVHISCTKH
jgi:hypothetical protein